MPATHSRGLGERSRERQLAPGALVPTASTPSTCDLRAIKTVYLLRYIDPRRLFVTASLAKSRPFLCCIN